MISVISFFIILTIGLLVAYYFVSSSTTLQNLTFTLLVVAPSLHKYFQKIIVFVDKIAGQPVAFSIAFVDVLALLLFGVLINRYGSRIRILPYNSFPFLIFLVLILIGVFQAEFPILALCGVWQWLKAYFLYWCVFNCLAAGFSLKALYRGLTYAGIIVTFQVLLFSSFLPSQLTSIIYSSAEVYLFLLLIFLPILCWNFFIQSRQKTLSLEIWVPGLIIYLGILVSIPIDIVFLPLIGLILVIIYCSRLPLVKSILPISILIVAYFLLILIGNTSFEYGKQEFQSTLKKVAWMILKDFPLGIGLNNLYAKINGSLYSVFFTKFSDEYIKKHWFIGWYQILCEAGIVGVVVLAFWFVRFVFYGFLVSWPSRHLEGGVTWGFSAGVTLSMVAGFWGTSFIEPAILNLIMVLFGASAFLCHRMILIRLAREKHRL